MDRKHLNVLNCGGGRQSGAEVLMAAHGLTEKPDIVLMADTGWERDGTIEFWHRYLVPGVQRRRRAVLGWRRDYDWGWRRYADEFDCNQHRGSGVD